MAILNPKYTFDSFIVGNSNRFPHAAAQAAAEEIGTLYNPLFIYGPPGLGKTHLIQAIGHKCLMLNDECKVTYVTSETFMDEFIYAIRNDGLTKFKNKYRRSDVLLVDDTQFLAGKESTLEEFHHTFNALYESNKQIVLTSDRPPTEIKPIEERLLNRFCCGLTIDISPPDLETRIAILRNKADLEHFSMPNECYTYIADNVKSNIRELEGALNRVVAYSVLNHTDITYEKCIEALTPIIPQKGMKVITIELIQEKVAAAFNKQVEDLCSQKRSRDVAVPRQIAMYLCRELTEESYPKIGKSFGGRDHSTAMHAHKEISKYLRSGGEQQINTQVNRIMDSIKSD
ncbi:MAG: chromosomal replication initiator protein DnaA [Clostridiales bacterium]|nr:chromosomal replication initiator protein DnaA [Clostridiales bacterium]